MAQYEVVFNANGPMGDMLNVVHYDVLDGDDPPDWDAFATVLRGHLVDHLQDQLATSITYTGITVREDVPGGVGQEYPFLAGDVVGTNADSDLAGQLAVLVQKLANNLVNPQKGRAYQGGITASALQADGRWNQGMADAVEAFWEDVRIMSLAGPSTLQMVIKRTNPETPNSVPYNPVAQINVVRNPATQRRRRLGVGS